MNDSLYIIVAALAGGVLGVIYFGGLWWTIGKSFSSPRPALWFLGSLLLRLGVALAGFYFVGDGQWKRLVACLFGFIAARLLVMRFTRAPRKMSMPPRREARHAS